MVEIRQTYTHAVWMMAGGLLVALTAILVLAMGSQAATLDISGLRPGGYILQDESVGIQVEAGATEVFTSGDQAVVTTPFGCTYGAPLGTGTSASLSYPADFEKLAGGSECFDHANTWASGSQDKQTYTVAINQDNQAPFADPSPRNFQARFTEVMQYERTERVTVQAYGYADAAVLDATRSDGKKFSSQPLEAKADEDGVVVFHLDLGPGEEEGGDLGDWLIKVIDISSSGITKKEDRGTIEVLPTTVIASWSNQPGTSEDDPTVQRMAPTNARLDLTYAGSLGHPDGERKMSFSDVNSGELDLLVSVGSSQFTASASFNQISKEWLVNHQVGKTDPVANDYRMELDISADKYGNEIIASPSREFSVVAAEVVPDGTVTSQKAERASTSKPLTAEIELRFPSGTAVAKDDVASISNDRGELQLHLFRDGTQLTNNPLLATHETDGLWTLEALLPKDIPLGSAQLRLVGPTTINNDAADGNPNRIVVDDDIGEVEIEAGTPTASLRVEDQEGKTATTFLRGDVLRAEVDFTYGDTSPVSHNDVFGGTGHGRAFLRIMPNGDPDATFHVDLQYNPAQRNWFVDYQIPNDDPVGNWQVAAVMSDQWGNRADAAKDVRVGMDVSLTLSSGSVLRSEDIVVSVLLSRPGDDTSLTGSVQLAVSGPGGIIADEPMLYTGQDYTYTVSIPADAALGTYTVSVLAQLSDDDGFAQGTFEVAPASIAAVDKSLTSTEVTRLGEIGFQFRLQYPNGGMVPKDGAAPAVAAVRSDGSFSTNLPVVYDDETKAWNATFSPSLATPTGDYRFSVSGVDAAGNTLEDQFSSEFDVRPAQIFIQSVATHRLQYIRGETLTIVAEAAYADGSIPTGVVIPATIKAGPASQGDVLLQYDSNSGRFTGTQTVPYSAPLSTSSMPWAIQVAAGTVQDGDGNVGPAFDEVSNQFSIAPATVTATIIEEPTNAGIRGQDTISIRFTLTAPDGSPITGHNASSMRVHLLRDQQVISNATIFFNEDAYVAEIALPDNVRIGDYTLRIGGVDAYGNMIQVQETNTFAVMGASGDDKGSPAVGIAALAIMVVAGAVIHRRR